MSNSNPLTEEKEDHLERQWHKIMSAIKNTKTPDELKKKLTELLSFVTRHRGYFTLITNPDLSSLEIKQTIADKHADWIKDGIITQQDWKKKISKTFGAIMKKFKLSLKEATDYRKKLKRENKLAKQPMQFLKPRKWNPEVYFPEMQEPAYSAPPSTGTGGMSKASPPVGANRSGGSTKSGSTSTVSQPVSSSSFQQLKVGDQVFVEDYVLKNKLGAVSRSLTRPLFGVVVAMNASDPNTNDFHQHPKVKVRWTEKGRKDWVSYLNRSDLKKTKKGWLFFENDGSSGGAGAAAMPHIQLLQKKAGTTYMCTNCRKEYHVPKGKPYHPCPICMPMSGGGKSAATGDRANKSKGGRRRKTRKHRRKNRKKTHKRGHKKRHKKSRKERR